jgi:S-adenosylmethionine/arginine decarboxylase-like enzyme
MSHIGKSLILDLFGAENTESLEIAKAAALDICTGIGAQVVFIEGQKLASNRVICVVGMHQGTLSLITWPLDHLVTMDLVLCASIDPTKAIGIMQSRYKPQNTRFTFQKRGDFSL